jgi:two-component system, NtrC family, sensor histidine kinase PilS
MPSRPPGVPEAFAAFESADEVWRTLTSFAVYRLVIVIVLATAFWGFTRFPIIGAASPFIATLTLATYLIAAVGLIIATQLRVPSPTIQLTAQTLIDIIMLVLLMHASGGARSGIGMLLLVSLAAGALVAHGRMALFHAAVAALAVLFEQVWQLLYMDGAATDFVPSSMLATGYFVIAGLGYTLAKYARGAEQIAEKRGVDLANLAEINELVIRDMQDGFVVVDENGVIRQHNQQSTMLIDGLTNTTGRQLSAVAPQLAQLLGEWQSDRSRIFSIIRDQRSKREYQVRFVAVGDGAISPTVVFLEDVSRIRSQAQQMKLVALGRLTASIAHEIRNPLSSINHAAELLEEDPNRNSADLRLLTIIHENAHRLDRLVEEVLYLNRRDRAHPEVIDTKIFLEQFVRDFAANEKRPASLFQIQHHATSKAVFDRSHLDQILWNLIRNAARYASGKPGAVSIVTADVGTNIVISVIDDGPGVETNALAHLFEPFFTTDAKGTGLGLYIARELAEVNTATLEYVVDNIANDDGTRVEFTENAIPNPISHFRLIMKGQAHT